MKWISSLLSSNPKNTIEGNFECGLWFEKNAAGVQGVKKWAHYLPPLFMTRHRYSLGFRQRHLKKRYTVATIPSDTSLFNNLEPEERRQQCVFIIFSSPDKISALTAKDFFDKFGHLSNAVSLSRVIEEYAPKVNNNARRQIQWYCLLRGKLHTYLNINVPLVFLPDRHRDFRVWKDVITKSNLYSYQEESMPSWDNSLPLIFRQILTDAWARQQSILSAPYNSSQARMHLKEMSRLFSSLILIDLAQGRPRKKHKTPHVLPPPGNRRLESEKLIKPTDPKKPKKKRIDIIV
jgi:hypothetical protein